MYNIQFFNDGKINPVWSVARELSSNQVERYVRPEDIYDAFRIWGDRGYIKQYFHVLGIMEGSKKKYRWGLRIWNYHKNDAPPNDMGVISLAREWGDRLSEYPGCRVSYYLGVVA